MPPLDQSPMTEFTSPEAWMEAAFRDAAFFSITSYQTEGGKRRVRKVQTFDWEQAHRCGKVLHSLNRSCTIYVVSRANHSVFLPQECWTSLDEIWREQHGQIRAGQER